MMTKLEQLEQAMQTHDWFYYMSDDSTVYNRGKESWIHIKNLMSQVPKEDAERLYQQYLPSMKF